jgi:hypothetical protein
MTVTLKTKLKTHNSHKVEKSMKTSFYRILKIIILNETLHNNIIKVSKRKEKEFHKRF